MMPAICSRCGALAARLIWPPTVVVLLEQHDVMAATRAHARRFQSGGARADDHDACASRPCVFAMTCGMVSSREVAAFCTHSTSTRCTAVDAVVGADALLDLVLAAIADLEDHVRIGDLRARHADHVDHAVRENPLGLA